MTDIERRRNLLYDTRNRDASVDAIIIHELAGFYVDLSMTKCYRR